MATVVGEITQNVEENCFEVYNYDGIWSLLDGNRDINDVLDNVSKDWNLFYFYTRMTWHFFVAIEVWSSVEVCVAVMLYIDLYSWLFHCGI